MLTIERFLRSNVDWEERAEQGKICPQWKQAYKKAHTKVRIKVQANEGNVKFGAQNSASYQETILTMENTQ